MKRSLLILFVALLIVSCGKNPKAVKQNEKSSKMSAKFINDETIEKTKAELLKKYGEEERFRIERGVEQTAKLWREEDGSAADFEKFCEKNFIADPDKLDSLFSRLEANFETIYGHFNKISLDLLRPLHLSYYEILPIDYLFGAWSPSAHLEDDFFKNKIAFHILLNFPRYSLEEKSELADKWTRKQWAFARVGDMFSSRVPAELNQKVSEALTKADAYISSYNIYMGNLVDDSGKTLFPKDLKLISHWGLRDELKSHYAEGEKGFAKQKIIYEVMKRIIYQEIPRCVINSDKYLWNPYKNEIYNKTGSENCSPEPNVRYKILLDNFKALKAIDPYNPSYPTYIKRKFEEEFEIPLNFVEKLFVDFISSPEMKQIGEIIKRRLGRELKPWDIWYDGFKARASMDESRLTKLTRSRYPNAEAFKRDMPNILGKLGFDKMKAKFIASRVEVDPARGSGHAWGADMKSENAHLRTRVGSKGMDYKGFNIAMHEFGHNVEQTISLQNVDYYFLRGVPNTAFTEAWAFVFQEKDLDVLGIKNKDPKAEASSVLDDAWSTYEIMGVSLVDIGVWKWMYKHPNATPAELKEEVIKIAKDVWNKYYAPVIGVKDSPILAIYSHMIDNPLYLSAYPIGYLIKFQLKNYIKGKSLGREMTRICSLGKLIPMYWLKLAVGQELSDGPMLSAAKKAIEELSKE